MKTGKNKNLEYFLDRFSEILKETDADNKKKETALLYLSKNKLDSENINDLFLAMESSLKESDRLLKVQQSLIKQGDSPVDLPWLNEAQAEVSMQQQGLLNLMLQLREKEINN